MLFRVEVPKIGIGERKVTAFGCEVLLENGKKTFEEFVSDVENEGMPIRFPFVFDTSIQHHKHNLEIIRRSLFVDANAFIITDLSEQKNNEEKALIAGALATQKLLEYIAEGQDNIGKLSRRLGFIPSSFTPQDLRIHLIQYAQANGVKFISLLEDEDLELLYTIDEMLSKSIITRMGDVQNGDYLYGKIMLARGWDNLVKKVKEDKVLLATMQTALKEVEGGVRLLNSDDVNSDVSDKSISVKSVLPEGKEADKDEVNAFDIAEIEKMVKDANRKKIILKNDDGVYEYNEIALSAKFSEIPEIFSKNMQITNRLKLQLEEVNKKKETEEA